MEKIVRWEVDSEISIFCPFCGHKVLDYDNNDISPCEHTLFAASDDGFEHRSELFDKNLGLHGIPDDDLDLPEYGIDGLTNQVTVANSIKIAQYEAPPSMLGGYVGFAPND